MWSVEKMKDLPSDACLPLPATDFQHNAQNKLRMKKLLRYILAESR